MERICEKDQQGSHHFQYGLLGKILMQDRKAHGDDSEKTDKMHEKT